MTTLSKMTTKSDSIVQKISECSGHASGIYTAVVFEDKVFSAAADGFVARWNIQLGTQDKFAINIGKPVYSLMVLHTGDFLMAGTNAGDLYVFDLENRSEIKHFVQHESAIFNVIENEQKNVFYSADADGNVAVWDSTTFELNLFLPLGCGKIRRMSVSADGSFLAIGGQDGFVRVLDTEFYNEVSLFYAHQDGVSAVTFHPKNRDILYSGGKDAILRLWEWKSGTMKKEIPAHNFVVYDILALPECKCIVSASRDKSIKIWTEDLIFLERIDQRTGGHRHSVNSLVKYSENQIVSVSDDKRIISWSILDKEN
jgi:centriolar protein POC1